MSGNWTSPTPKGNDPGPQTTGSSQVRDFLLEPPIHSQQNSYLPLPNYTDCRTNASKNDS